MVSVRKFFTPISLAWTFWSTYIDIYIDEKEEEMSSSKALLPKVSEVFGEIITVASDTYTNILHPMHNLSICNMPNFNTNATSQQRLSTNAAELLHLSNLLKLRCQRMSGNSYYSSLLKIGIKILGAASRMITAFDGAPLCRLYQSGQKMLCSIAERFEALLEL